MCDRHQTGLIPDTTLARDKQHLGRCEFQKAIFFFFFPSRHFQQQARQQVKGSKIEIKIQKEGNGERGVCVSVPCRAAHRICARLFPV